MTDSYLNKYKIDPAREAYKIWHERRSLLCKYAKNMKAVDIEDAYSQSFIFILEAIGRYKNNKRSFISWVLFYVKQKMFNYIETKGKIVSNYYYARKHPELHNCRHIISVDNYEESDIIDNREINKPEFLVSFNILAQKIELLLKRLPPRWEMILRMYYGIGEKKRTLTAIADVLNISTERTRQIKIQAENKLRSILYNKKIGIGDLLDYEA